MMSNLKIVFCFILCAGALVGGAAMRVSAQTGNGGDKILVAGNPSLRQSQIDRVIEFYEWAFAARFTAAERARFRTIHVEAFRQDAAASTEGAETLIRALKQVRAKDEDAQQKMRRQFNADFVKDLRASSDEIAQLLLGVYERGKEDSGGGEEEETVSAPEAPEVLKPSGAGKVVGKWMRSTGAGGADDGTGKTRYNSGANTTFEFSADGTVQFTYDKQVLSITQCRITELTKIRGTYEIQGNRLTMNFSAGTSVGTSSCEKAGNFRKTLSASTLTKSFVVRRMESPFRPDAPQLICFDGQNEDNDCFERDPKF